MSRQHREEMKSQTERDRRHERYRADEAHRRRHRDKDDDTFSRSDRTRDKDYDHRHRRERRHHRYDDSDDSIGENRRKDRSRHRETSTERAERKRRKKERHVNDVEKRAKAAEVLLYSADTSGKQDEGPSETFRWAKKAEKERKQGITPEQARRRDEQQRRETEEEIRQLNIRRAQREQEQSLRAEEESRMARMAESAAMAEWVAKEDDFYLEQSRKRAIIRVKENRAKPIDLLAVNLKWVNGVQQRQGGERSHPVDQFGMDDDEEDLEVDLEEPYLLFDSLNLEETEELFQDIQMYLSLEKNEQNLDFWRSLIVVCDDKLADLRVAAGQVSQEAGVRTAHIDPQTKKDVDQMLSGKTYEQLNLLQNEVRTKLQSGEAINVEDWEQYLKSIIVWRAKAKLRDMHEVILNNRLEHLRRRRRTEEARRQKLGLPSIEEEKAAKAQEAARRHTDNSGNAVQDSGDAMAAEMVAREADKKMEEDEDVFDEYEDLNAVESAPQSGSYAWEDKYRPRKPRYYNKVITGFEWNKYNQTHYDEDNPPPKAVQGYKFNVFYPDLIDKSKPPTYRIIKERGNDETCLLVFEAGPPYETIGFRIINKPWNMSHQRGFKAVFERGVLQLHCECLYQNTIAFTDCLSSQFSANVLPQIMYHYHKNVIACRSNNVQCFAYAQNYSMRPTLRISSMRRCSFGED